jgi:hypothetical protein
MSDGQTSYAKKGEKFAAPPPAGLGQFNCRELPRGRRTSHRDSSLHTRLMGHVGQRRPFSSRPSSLQASLREHARELRKAGWLRFLSISMLVGLVQRRQAGRLRQRVRFTSVSASYSRPADCSLPVTIVGALPAIRIEAGQSDLRVIAPRSRRARCRLAFRPEILGLGRAVQRSGDRFRPLRRAMSPANWARPH